MEHILEIWMYISISIPHITTTRARLLVANISQEHQQNRQHLQALVHHLTLHLHGPLRSTERFTAAQTRGWKNNMAEMAAIISVVTAWNAVMSEIRTICEASHSEVKVLENRDLGANVSFFFCRGFLFFGIISETPPNSYIFRLFKKKKKKADESLMLKTC